MTISEVKKSRKQPRGDRRAPQPEKQSTPALSREAQQTQRGIGYQAAESAGAAIWRRDQQITGLWSKNEPRNSWISIAGVGWRKLANANDSVTAALTVLASQAIATGRHVDCREESDRMIHEIYLW
jgi:hypothetical protein